MFCWSYPVHEFLVLMVFSYLALIYWFLHTLWDVLVLITLRCWDVEVLRNIYIYIDKNVFKTTRSFCYQWFHVSTLQANATKHGKKTTTLNLWIVVNRIKCKRFLNSKPITRRRYIHTFIYERLFLACQTFQNSSFTSEYTPLTSQNAHTSSFKATYHDGDTIYY